MRAATQAAIAQPTRRGAAARHGSKCSRMGRGIARTDLLRRLGPFDPTAFLFYEDLELCLRARAAGFPVELRPEVRLVHDGGPATGPALGDRALDLQARRRRDVVGAYMGARALALDDAAQALTFAVRAATGRRRARNVAELRALGRARRG